MTNPDSSREIKPVDRKGNRRLEVKTGPKRTEDLRRHDDNKGDLITFDLPMPPDEKAIHLPSEEDNNNENHRAGSAHLSEKPFEFVSKETYFSVLKQTITELAKRYVTNNKLTESEICVEVFINSKKDALKKIMAKLEKEEDEIEMLAEEKEKLELAISADLHMSQVREIVREEMKNLENTEPLPDNVITLTNRRKKASNGEVPEQKAG